MSDVETQAQELIDSGGTIAVLAAVTIVLVRVVRTLFDRLIDAAADRVASSETRRAAAEKLAADRLDRLDLITGELANVTASRDFYRALAERLERDLTAATTRPRFPHEGDTPS